MTMMLMRRFTGLSGTAVSSSTLEARPTTRAKPAKGARYEMREEARQLMADARRLERTYPALGRLQRIQVVSRDGNGEWQGRVWSIVLDGSRADRTITGDSFRWLFGLRSSWFTFTA